MKKFLNFSLCMLLALSLPAGNVAASVNAAGNNENVDAISNTVKADATDSTTEGEVENDQESVSVEETTETPAAEIVKEAEATPAAEGEQEIKETKEPEVTKDAKKTDVSKETEEAKTTEEKAEFSTTSKKTVATQSNVKKSAMQTKSIGLNFTIDLDIANKVDTVLTVDGKEVESTKKNVTVEIKNLKVTKSNGKKVIMFEDKVFANSGLREYYSIGLPFTDKKQMTVCLDFVVKVNGTEYTIPFEKTYKGSDEECKAFGYMNIDITKAQVLDAITHTVTFVDHDGTTLSVNEGILTGTSAVAPANPERTGYTFTGWSEAFDKITGDLTVKAQYKVNEYNVTFADYDGSQIGEVQKVEYEKSATAPAEPVREGYTFIGWDKAFDKITGDVTVTAEYEINKYKVTFVDYDTSQIGKVQEVEYGKAATEPEEPTRAGYTFIGWDVNFHEVKGDLTVTAQYEMLPSVLTGTAAFFILKGDKQPEEPASYPSENYTYVGDGIIKQEAVYNNDAEVTAHIVEVPLLSIEEGWTVRWYVIKKEADGWHVDGMKVKVSSGGAIDEEENVPEETIEPTEPSTGSAIETMEPSTGSAIETMEPSTGSAIETTAPTATPGNIIPYIPYIGPFTPQNTQTPAPTSPVSSQKTEETMVPEVSNNTTEAPTSIPTEVPSTEIPTTGTNDEKEDTNGSDADESKNATATPSANVEIKEDPIPDASPAVSSTPDTDPTVVPTEAVEGTATPDTEDGITVQDNELPDSASTSDEETDASGKGTENQDAVELEEDEIANSGAKVDEEDTDDEDAAEEETEEEDADADTEEVEEDEVANALPKTGVMSSNVFYFAGSMICALGVCIMAAVRRKTAK